MLLLVGDPARTRIRRGETKMQATEEMGMDPIEVEMAKLRTEIRNALESPHALVAHRAQQMIRELARGLGMVDEEKAA